MSEGITTSGSEVINLPQKRYYRQRAHVNPIADHKFPYPFSPDQTDWWRLYDIGPAQFSEKPTIRHLDVGCGFGGLLISLSSEINKGELALGLEIRTKVSEYVKQRILALRSQNPDKYHNIWCERTNAMRYIPNYIHKGQLYSIFFLFPDPHFKRTKHKWRIITDALLAEYAYVCAIGAKVYIATDVKGLFDWMSERLAKHPLFEPIPESELSDDRMIALITNSTEEGKKVARQDGDKFYAVFRRISHRTL